MFLANPLLRVIIAGTIAKHLPYISVIEYLNKYYYFILCLIRRVSNDKSYLFRCTISVCIYIYIYICV